MANISYVASVEVIALRIDPVFTTDERREILRTIAEWNHALNGHVRLEVTFAAFLVDPQRVDWPPVRTNSWSILPARSAAPLGPRVATPMALLQPTPHGGGVVMIFREQVGPPPSPPRCAMSSVTYSAFCTIPQAA